MKKINSYKNGVLHEWMTARISFALTMPLCRDNGEKCETLNDIQDIMLNNVFNAYGSDACDYAKRLLDKHPIYHSWKELEKTSSDMEEGSVYISREVYESARAEIMMLNHAGLAEVYPSQCDEGVYITVYACAQVRRKIDRIIDNGYKYVIIVNGFKEV